MTILEQVQNSLPLTQFDVIDCHCHIGLWGRFNANECGENGLIKSMREVGTLKSLISSHSAIGPDFKFGNTEMLNAVTKFPDCFFGYAVINPHYKSEIKEELERCFSNESIIGIKIHAGLAMCQIDNPNYEEAYEYANMNKKIVLLHTWSLEDVNATQKIADKYKDAIFIMGHGGGPEYMAQEQAIKAVNSYSNIYLDTALSQPYNGNIEYLVGKADITKILYGTDCSFYSPLHTLGRIAYANISDDHKKAIFGGNIKKILVDKGMWK
jgi:predicted TIM-barrel fold metal-dependent hydrolase